MGRDGCIEFEFRMDNYDGKHARVIILPEEAYGDRIYGEGAGRSSCAGRSRADQVGHRERVDGAEFGQIAAGVKVTDQFVNTKA